MKIFKFTFGDLIITNNTSRWFFLQGCIPRLQVRVQGIVMFIIKNKINFHFQLTIKLIFFFYNLTDLRFICKIHFLASMEVSFVNSGQGPFKLAEKQSIPLDVCAYITIISNLSVFFF